MFTTRNAPGRAIKATTASSVAALVVIASWHGDVILAEQHQPAWLSAQVSKANGSENRDSSRDELERLSEQEIKAFYVRCSQEAAEHKLGGSEAMICSIGYDVLLKRHFSGNFDLLLAWSRAQQKRQHRGQ